MGKNKIRCEWLVAMPRTLYYMYHKWVCGVLVITTGKNSFNSKSRRVQGLQWYEFRVINAAHEKHCTGT